jgi:hypothetical protein
VKGVEHGDGIGELVADGVRVAAERLQGGGLDAGVNSSPCSISQPA